MKSVLPIIKTELLTLCAANQMSKHLHYIILMCCLFVSNGICVAQIYSTNELVLKFKPRAISLSVTQKQQLKAFKKLHCNDTATRVIVFAAGGNHPNRVWNRVRKVINFLGDKTLDSCNVGMQRIGYGFDGVDSEDEIMIRWGIENEGPNMVPAPHPKYIKQ